MNLSELSPWERMQKELTWNQIGACSGMDVLDFGSGNGVTAANFARENRVTAIEPSSEMLSNRDQSAFYCQIQGDIQALRTVENASFDRIFCHNVLEYADERVEILQEFARLLRPNGILSILKHNKPGRVMQMAVLLNRFDHAQELLDGADGSAVQFGTIRYYQDEELLSWAPKLQISQIFGMRTFWDLQQNQEIQQQRAWQLKMMALESRVSQEEPYRSIAFFHHILLKKR